MIARTGVALNDREPTREIGIGEPVISLPHGDDVVWLQTLDQSEPGVATICLEPREPATPVIELIDDETDDSTGDEEG